MIATRSLLICSFALVSGCSPAPESQEDPTRSWSQTELEDGQVVYKFCEELEFHLRTDPSVRNTIIQSFINAGIAKNKKTALFKAQTFCDGLNR